jgi:hypothetical protein
MDPADSESRRAIAVLAIGEDKERLMLPRG